MIPLINLLVKYIPLHFKKSFFLGFVLILICGTAEVFSLNSIIPFLNALQDVDYQSSQTDFLVKLVPISFNNSELIIPAFIFAFSALITSSLRIYSFWFNSKLLSKIGTYLSDIIFTNFLNKEYETHINEDKNKSLMIFTKHLDSTVKAIELLFQGVSSTFISLFIIFTLISFNLNLTLLAFSIFIIYYGFIIIYFKKKILLNGKIIADQQQNRVKLIRNTIGGIRDIIINQNNKYLANEFNKSYEILRSKTVANSVIAFFPKYLLEGVGIAIISIISVLIYSEGDLNRLTLLGGAAYAAQRLLPSIQVMFSSWTGLKTFQANINVIEKELGKIRKNTFKNSNKANTFSNFKSIQLLNVSYKYPFEKRKVLLNCNIKINRGETIGIIGKTGSGKSTLIDILIGLLTPSNGSIIIDDNLLNCESTIDIAKWRECISHVPQDIFLKDETIISNILGDDFKQNITNKKKFKTALEASQVIEFLPSLPKGLNTIVGDKGVRLSGGQKQRISIARALLMEKSLLVLDEGTSSIDDITENKIMRNIKKYYPIITILMITHNKSNLIYCDKIFEISKGRLKNILLEDIN